MRELVATALAALVLTAWLGEARADEVVGREIQALDSSAFELDRQDQLRVNGVGPDEPLEGGRGSAHDRVELVFPF